MVVSEPELIDALATHMAEPHPQAQEQIDANNERIRKNNILRECGNIDIQISIVDQQIWQMEQAGNSSQRLVEKRRQLKNLEDRRAELNCGSVA